MSTLHEATLVLNFKESPYSPWGTEIASRSRTAGSRRLTTAAEQNYSASVGRISAVNALIGERGLERRIHLPPLVVDGSCSGRVRERDHWRQRTGSVSPSCSSGESESETEMDRKTKRGRRRGKAKPTPKPSYPPTVSSSKVQSSATGKEEEVKSKPLPLALDETTSDSDEEDGEEERNPADTALIELASFPGYDPDHPTPLPHALVPLEQMKRVTRAQTKLASKREGFREAWKQLFYSPSSLAIYQDYFWWYFLHRYQSGEHPAVQDLLFARISSNYVALLCDPIEERWRGAFFKMYPDVVAQCVYTTFIYAYPTSWNNFDEEFKTELCQFISLWQVGTKPLPNSWGKWELELLEPQNLLKHVVKDEQKSPKRDSKSPRRGTFNLDSLIKDAQKRENVVSESSAAAAAQQSNDDTDEDKKIMLSDIERALASPSVSQHKLSPRSSIVSNKVAKPLLSSGSREVTKKEKAREQLSSLKKMLTEKTSLSPNASSQRASLSHKSSVQEELVRKQSQSKPVNSSNRLSVGAKQGVSPRPSLKQSVPPSPKQKLSVTGSQKSGSSHLSARKKDVASGGAGGKSDEAAGPSQKKEESKRTWKEKALELCAKRKADELAPLEGPEFEHSVFDVCGHSPLVKLFLKNKNLKHKKEHSTLVKRTEISELPPAEAVCYKDILDQSKEFEKKNQSSFKRHYRHQRQSMRRYQQTRREASTKHELAVQKVLLNKKETQELSNELTVHVLTNEKCPNRVAISRAVNETLDRVVHSKKTG